MADDIDVAQELNERFQALALAAHHARAAAPRSRKKCEHCEENPADVAPNGVQLRYCGRCRDELTPPRIAPTSCADPKLDLLDIPRALMVPQMELPGVPAIKPPASAPKHFVLRGGKLQAAA